MKFWGCAGVILSVACAGERPEFGQMNRDASPSRMVESSVREETSAGEVDASFSESDASVPSMEPVASMNRDQSEPEETATLSLAPRGVNCEGDEDCESTHCADGVCCDTACDGVCASCNQSGHEGTCTATPNDDACADLLCPPSTECLTYVSNSLEDNCDVLSQCKVHAACDEIPENKGTPCRSGAGECDGRGECVGTCPTTSGTNRTCSEDCPCSSGEGVCTTDTDCSGGNVCATGAGAKFGFDGNTCVAAHCDNNAMDGGETSADCGGECGCRATHEVLTLTGAPSGSVFTIVGMSGDGSRFIANSWELMFGYAFVISRSGEVTQLDHLGGSGSAGAISGDGSVVVGSLVCPGDMCSGTYKWINSAPPVRVGDYGNVHGTSASGNAFVAGMDPPYYSSPSANGNIFELYSAVGVSPDGMFVIGKRDSDSAIDDIWSAESRTVTPITKDGWSAAHATAIKGSPPVVVGSGSAGSGSVGFRWVGGQVTEFGTLPGMTSYVVMDVSSDGTVAVGYARANITSTSRAFIWSESGGIRLLEDELTARGLELPLDAQFINADFITDDGTTIVGGHPTSTLWRVTLTE